MTKDTIIKGDALEVLKTFPDQSVHCCITSPPYWGLRDYGVEGQMGLEKTPEEFIEKMVVLFREVRRVLRDDGVLWVNIGDCYAAGKMGRDDTDVAGRERLSKHGHNGGANKVLSDHSAVKSQKAPPGLKPKDLVGIPWLLAFALRADGWYLRQDIIWHKPNPMPESTRDRCTKSHEYLFMLSKKARYYYDAPSIRTQAKTEGIYKMPDGWDTGEGGHGSFHRNGREKGQKQDKQSGHSQRHAGFNDRWDHMTEAEQQAMGANKRSVWTVATAAFKEAHFATFPEALIVDCIKAGCPAGGIVLDPFMGAGTTALVAKKQGRHFLGIELNPAYIEIANNRLKKELGLFA